MDGSAEGEAQEDIRPPALVYGDRTALGGSRSSTLRGRAPEGLKDLVGFYMKRLFRQHSHQKAKERSRLPGFAVTELFCLW